MEIMTFITAHNQIAFPQSVHLFLGAQQTHKKAAMKAFSHRGRNSLSVIQLSIPNAAPRLWLLRVPNICWLMDCMPCFTAHNAA